MRQAHWGRQESVLEVAMDQAIRNKLQRATQDARRLLEREFAEQLEGTFDILPDGTILPEPGGHLDEHQRLVRGKLVDAVQHRIAGGKQPAEAVDDYTREAAFTCLNRFVALKMLEARGLVQQCVSKGDESAGFKEFTGLAPGLSRVAGQGLSAVPGIAAGRVEHRGQGAVRPPRSGVASVAAVGGLGPDCWGSGTTPTWPGFGTRTRRLAGCTSTSTARKSGGQMREASQAPRNSRELAVRNQFFTPRYVVQFLTDNTLGRIWYEMRRKHAAGPAMRIPRTSARRSIPGGEYGQRS